MKIKISESLLGDFVLFMTLGLLFIPSSNQIDTINSFKTNLIYLLTAIFLLFVIGGIIKKFCVNKLQATMIILFIASYIIYTIITKIVVPFSPLYMGDIIQYFPIILFLVFPIKQIKISGKHADIFLSFLTLILVILGICILFDISNVEEFLRTNYSGHTFWFMDNMLRNGKPVTIFVTHSVACYAYFIIYMCWEFNERCNKTLKYLSMFFMALFLVFCRCNSSLLCVFLLVAYYIYRFHKKISVKYLLIMFGIFVAISVFIIVNRNEIALILNSSSNGIAGRYTAVGALSESIKYVLSGGLPTGFCTLDYLVYTDSGFLSILLRGGIISLISFHIALFLQLRSIIKNGSYLFIFFTVLAFEIGYPVLIDVRFIVLFIFTCLYFYTV